MRFILSLFVLLAFAAPTMAAENTETQKPVMIKGSKSYQMRYTKPVMSPASVEPAAGVEMDTVKSENPSAVAPSNEEKATKKMMKLHGKK
jgi:hypothetical protein